MRLIIAIVGANIAGALIALGLGSALINQSCNYFQAGLMLLGLAINISVGSAAMWKPRR